MVQIRTLDMRGGALGDGSQLLDGGSSAATLKTFIALAQGIRDDVC